ncbi:TldD/PmbA family protein [Micromonospora sp. WMMD1128]|uniref:TldD/PmbA family protein n=1 Tax=Micromonospora sp. WMMD1128 TaxID=3015150 RepID=UPI00248C988D|nr:TldD/PmbA family protein [Micromonospora sp. WMMD1128]WBB75831.1 TldD/PmbA family protein [Micromonospora sp. WMMD1128]
MTAADTAAGIEPSFLALPLAEVTDAVLGEARRLGARHAAVRVVRNRARRLLLHDGRLRGSRDDTELGLSVGVLHEGARGFAAVPEVDPAAAVDAVGRAVQVARVCREVGAEPVELAPEPVYADRRWTSHCRVDPFAVPEADAVALLADWSRGLLAAPVVRHVLAKVSAVRETTWYADTAGTSVLQQRVRVHPQVLAVGAAGGTTATLRTLGPPTGRGWEYLHGSGWDWAAELAEIPDQLAGKLRARPVRPGRYDLVTAPSHLWLTIHESVGHATEADRALGHEIGYAGGTFATPADVDTLRYGSELMTVTADRTDPHGLATVGWDDEGVATGAWTLVRDGVLTGFQTDRHTAVRLGAARSTGCAYAESAEHVPISRLPNVSLRPAPDGPDTAALIGGVTDGIFLVGSDSWSIDTQRRRFQFTAQLAYRIRHGRLGEQLSGVAYQADTTDFWGSLVGLGGPGTYRCFGADLCGKGQPVQAAAASHGAPTAVFRGVRVVDTSGEGPR